jgi:1-aminocyclopropane-1-carboxylate deaminase
MKEALLFNSSYVKNINLEPLVGLPFPIAIYLDVFNHPLISGNKLRKLYGSIVHAKEKGYRSIVTIGGNYSNHLYAAAHIPEIFGIDVAVIVKGHEPKIYGYTLQTLRAKNIPIHFVSKETLKERYDETILSITNQYPNALFIPEGGTNEFASLGFEPLIKYLHPYDTILCPIGTGGTAAAIDLYKPASTKLLAYAALNDTSLSDRYAFEISYQYTMGGYAKVSDSYFEFLNRFESLFHVPLDPIYTGKMMFGLIEDIKKGIFSPNQHIVAIHTGGLHGWHGFKKK